MTMTKHTTILAALLGLTTLIGCATPDHRCTLGDERCQSVSDINEAARSGGSERADNVNVAPIAPQEYPEWAEGPDREGRSEGGQFRPYDGRLLRDRPVYSPAEPVRIWLAPWRDRAGDELMRGGQYIYATDEGGWNYGEIRDPGGASQMLGPMNPDDLGFEATDDEEQPERVQPERRINRNNR